MACHLFCSRCSGSRLWTTWPSSQLLITATCRRHVFRHDRCRHIWDDRQNVTTQKHHCRRNKCRLCNTVSLLLTNYTIPPAQLIPNDGINSGPICSQHRFNLDKPQSHLQPKTSSVDGCRGCCVRITTRPSKRRCSNDVMSFFVLSCNYCFYLRRIVLVHIKLNPVCIFQLNISSRDEHTPIWH